MGLPLFLWSRSGPEMLYTMFSRRVDRSRSVEACGRRRTDPFWLVVVYADAYFAAAIRFWTGNLCFDIAPNTVDMLMRSAAAWMSFLLAPVSVE